MLMLKSIFYLVFRKKQRPYDSLGVRVTDRSPKLDAGEVAVRVVVDLPSAMFQRPALSAHITVSPDQVRPTEIEASVAENIADVVRQHTGLDLKITIEPPEA